MAEKIYHRRLAASHTTAKIASIEIKETESSISINGVQVPNSYKDIDLTRYIARLVSNKHGTSNKGKTNCSYLYGKDIEEQLLVDSWLSFVVDDEKKNQVEKLQYLDKSLSATSTTSKYLVGTTLTIADIVVFCWLENLQDKKAICVSNKLTHVERWSQFISSLPSFKNAEDKNQSQTKNSNPDTKEQGKFVELPGAELGKVVVRFPPEASGYLHIGHAKAALLNQYYQEQFKGRLVMRFDDTNPAKEKEDYEKVILEDVKLLEIKPDVFSYTSNYFDKMISLCEQMLKKRMVYVDDTDPETMKQEREKRIESKNRNNSVDKNVKLWNEMLSATPTGLKCCVRAKIDMLSDNGCMRDPAIYRCKPETHPRTGNKYKVYPTYDFACPIVDSLEGVTHALRTTEYADRDQQYYWFCDALELNPRPYVWSYSRLNMTNTVLSKRKLTWFVDEGLVDGWDDPRMPTVRGVLRRGMQVEALRQFIIAQGSSRTVVTMEWDKIWSINKRIVDPVAPRHTTVELNASVPVYVEDVKEPYVIKNVQRHPKNPDLGTKDVWITPTLLIDYVDAEGLASSGVGAKVTFINWGNVIVTKINKNSSGKIESINIKTALNDTDYKKTTKLTWLPKIVPAENKSSDVPALVPCFCVFFNHLISKPVLAKDEDFKQYVSDLEDLSSCKTRLEVPMLGDPELRNVKKGQVIQLQRRPGYFICDTPYQPFSIHTSKECPVILFSVPDGHTKQQATVSSGNSAASEKKSNQAQTPNCANTTNQENELYTRVTEQGDKVRQLKSSGASKDAVSEAVKALLALKAEYKQASGKDYQPNQPPAKSAPTPPTNAPSTTNQEEQLYARVTEQGDKVRQLKSSGASKDAVSEAVKALLALKAEYKQASGKDYQPNQPPAKSAPTQPTNAPSTTNQEEQLYARVTEQGDKVRQLKSSGASKDAVSEAVKALLALKAEYKQASGKDYQPNQPPVKSAPTQPTNVPSTTNQEEQLYARVTEQGDKVRQLKSSGASKDAVSEAVKALLALKAEYKQAAGKDYQPNQPPAKSAPTQPTNVPSTTNQEEQLYARVTEQGDKVRQLKSSGASKDAVSEAVKALLALKAEYKQAAGKDYQPNQPPAKSAPTQPTNVPSTTNQEEQLYARVTEQGDKVRQLKSSGASKDAVSEAVKALLALKAEYKSTVGKEYQAGAQTSKPQSAPPSQKNVGKSDKKGDKKVDQKKKQEKSTASVNASEAGVKKITRLGLEAKKFVDLPDWYSQVLTKGEMIEYYDVSGCYVLRPWSFGIWEQLQKWFDNVIKRQLGVRNCYFPIFVSKAVLEKEKAHIEDFAPEVAWVTKSGDTELQEHIAIRPTSETVMYPAFAKWIQSYRDLPLKLNQWNNVVRWEFKHPQPFLRTREFLWQEGHHAYATQDEAERDVLKVLDFYKQVYEDLLAVPVVPGKKTEKEKFAGGVFTTTVEAYVPASGRAIQAATSHYLGTNFARMFDVQFEHPDTHQPEYAHQISYGMTTRTIGVMVMVHGDDRGLLLPPKVATVQVIIVPCGVGASTEPSVKDRLLNLCDSVKNALLGDQDPVPSPNSIRAETDLRDNYSPGWKFNHWELKGVPLRIEIGPKDMEAGRVIAIRRDTSEKIEVSLGKEGDLDSGFPKKIQDILDRVQSSMLEKARNEMNAKMVVCKDWSKFCPLLDSKHILLIPFCGRPPCEDLIKKDSAKDTVVEQSSVEGSQEQSTATMGAKSLCIPYQQPKEPENQIGPKTLCLHPECGQPAAAFTLFGRSY
ncbi:bifunctional glutamate/proline--tRNA ligase-like isoform X15 [Adelges cooleyi]|uniref:bifunctional glutamate/proline--tRNA ligase-like isoform X15 n=1 Tax=Adelges cooleyi TaxID=133065 RepID=UPI0021807391|nr:bifunctional glutamate/proline--tRNA ligase-like isoform X15 [Adelges cooleyi]